MIADASFGTPRRGVRPLRFVPRSSIPIDAACVVARRIGETLRELFGERCEIAIGEPAPIGAQAWEALARDALLFVTRGRQTDVVLVVPHADARRLVLRAFGEADPAIPTLDLPAEACSALELHALERIAARCAAAFEPLAAVPAAEARRIASGEVPSCAAYFDLRVRTPVALTMGIGVVRDLPPQGLPSSLSPAALEAVRLDARAIFAEGTIGAADFLALRRGDVVRLETQVASPASLKCGSRRLATGIPGVVGSRTAFLVSDVEVGAV